MVINNGEKFIFKITTSEGTTYTAETTYYVKNIENKIIYAYAHRDEFVSWDVTTDKNAIPIKIKFTEKGNQMNYSFNGNGKVNMSGFWNGKMVNEKGTFSKNVTVENALVAITLDLNLNNKYVFDLIQTDKLPNLKPFKMYFKVEGEERVMVKAGTFKCKKVLFTLTDFRSIFYKAYYYITDDEHRYIVKIDNMPMGGATELTSIER